MVQIIFEDLYLEPFDRGAHTMHHQCVLGYSKQAIYSNKIYWLENTSTL